MARRVGKIVESRRLFVVTIDYIGPDRRTDPERAEDPNLIQGPNALRAKAIRDIRSSATPEAIAACRKEINLHRIGRCYPAIRFTIERLRKSFESGANPGDRATQLTSLQGLIGDLKNRIKGTDFADSTKLCVAMSNMAAKIQASGDGITAVHF